MKLPPKPQPKLNAIGQWVDPTNKELMKWGRACAKAALEAAAKMVEGWGEPLSAEAIRSIKIED